MRKNIKFGIFFLCILSIFIVTVFFGNILKITGFVTKTGQLEIGNSAPTVDFIYLNDKNTTDTPGDVVINPTTNSTTAIIVKARITDLNGDCNTFTSNNATAYFCDGAGSCNSGNADHTISMNYDASDGQWGAGNKYCNMTGSSEDWEFYEINGTWKVNVTITDGINTTYTENSWEYNELRSFTYPASGDTIEMGSLNVGQWNNGTAGDLILNAGNIVLDLKWNATDFTGQTHGQIINVSRTNNSYIIDDDGSSPDDTGNIPEVYINQTQKYFGPASGLIRCSSVGCSDTNATFNVYWHIDIPSGLVSDTYQNTIQLESSDH